MAIVVSSRIFTMVDVAGNPASMGFYTIEFRDANYTTPGEAMDLSATMRWVEYVITQPLSGTNLFDPRVVQGDFPGNAGSGRLSLYYQASGIVTLNISGLAINVLSGSVFITSGFGQAMSGRIGVTGSGAFNAGLTPLELLSGTAVSGTRAALFVLGA